MIKLNGYEVKPTLFPDGTSQIWKLPKEALQKQNHHIDWEFQNEGELMQILQLGTLIKAHYSIGLLPSLRIPFLPYSRQDKPISNDSTFALKVFINILNTSNMFSEISTIDVHNPKSLEGSVIKNLSASYEIEDILELVKPSLICFPDKGAATRGYPTKDIPVFSLDKKRNQETGEIEGLKTDLPLDLTGRSILILDDICDGGRTFIEAAKVLYNLGASDVHLYTTHGIYSKGTEPLREAGIKRIFNYKEEV